MQTTTLKNIMVSSLLAASACMAVISPANAASNNAFSHSNQSQHKNTMSQDKDPLSKLNLSAKQRDQIRNIKYNHRNDGKKGQNQAKKEIANILTAKQRRQLNKMTTDYRVSNDYQGRDNKGHSR